MSTEKNTTRTGLEQGRAAYAYECSESGAGLEKNKEFKSYVKKMPMLIKTNGLGAAVAFVFAKGSKEGIPQPKDPWGLLYIQLAKWLHEKGNLGSFSQNKLAERLTECESSQYRAATTEVLALLNWMKRFADALIAGESQD